MPRPSSHTVRTAAILGFWTLLGVLESSKDYVGRELQGGHTGWPAALLGNMPWWWCWALLTPAVFRLTAAARLDRPRWMAGSLVHLLAALTFSLIHLTVVGTLYWHTTTRHILPYLPAPTRQRIGTPLGQVEAFLNGYLVVDVMTYGAVVLGWYVLEYRTWMRERERAALALEARAATLEAQMHEARLDALRMELNPHFLFNALNATAGLVRRGDATRAVEMLARLGTLLRLTLERDTGHEVALGRELELLDLYLDIERTRFSDRLRIDMDVDPAALEALVPAFVLQPLVENAIRHGISRLAEPGWIRISARVHEQHLSIRVANTGPRLSPAAEAGKGVGLRNTRARLVQLYGTAASLTLEPGADGGTTARLTLPRRDDVANLSGSPPAYALAD